MVLFTIILRRKVVESCFEKIGKIMIKAFRVDANTLLTKNVKE